uniref:SET domain-containing protein n=1 Tax=Macrostomum lignano TaxID=282301 RepID=A0A1I8JP46_9PLAT
SLDSLLTSLASVTSFPKEEIGRVLSIQEVSAFPPRSTLTSPVIVLSSSSLSCTLDIGKFGMPREIPSRVPDPTSRRRSRISLTRAHRHALVCRQLARSAVNHALTLEQGRALCLMESRGREAYQRVRAKLAVVSSSEQKVGRLMELPSWVRTQTGCQRLRSCGMSNEHRLWCRRCSWPAIQRHLCRLLAPKQGAECGSCSATFIGLSRSYERYGQMINKFMKKDSQLLTDLMRQLFQVGQHLLNSCLDDCQNVKTLGNVQAGLSNGCRRASGGQEAGTLGDGLARRIWRPIWTWLHDNVYRGIFEALTAYFKATKASKESDLTALSKSRIRTPASRGAVRDLLMSKTPHDLDFATTATPEEMVSMFNAEGVRMINSNGLAHGTVTARIGDAENFEFAIVSFWVEIGHHTAHRPSHDGRHAIVEFTRDWALDASRRDLTINAMFFRLGRPALYDYFNGRNDLATRRVRFVGDAGDRIREDYLRILRYFRFHGRIAERRLMPISVADEADKETLAAVAQNAAGLGGIAGERIWVELKQILAGRRPDDLIGAMASCGVCAFIGLPAEPNVQELGVVLNRLPLTPTMSESIDQCGCVSGALLRSNDELETAHARLKFSNEELGVLRFVLELRAALALVDNSVEEQRDFYQDLAALTSGKDPAPSRE